MEKIFNQKWSVIDYAKFVTPSVLAVVSVSLYMVVDAYFIARYVGPLAMASVNIILPYFNFAFGIGIMVASGASAIIGIELGKKDIDQALKHFSLTCAFIVILAVILAIGSKLIGVEKIASLLGASEVLLPYCTVYLNIFVFAIGGIMLQIVGEFFMRLDGKPIWAFYSTVAAGLTNIALDYVLIVQMDMGIFEAGIASVMGVCVALGISIYYFLYKSRILKFSRPVKDWFFLKSTLVNGSSEMVSELSAGVKMLVFNYVVLSYAGEYGVAAMSIIMYLYYMMMSLNMGISMGISPIFSFNYGKQDFTEIQAMLKMSVIAIALASIISFAVSMLWGEAIIRLFAEGHQSVITIAKNGLFIIAFSFLLEGMSIFASGFFTSVNNGKISALISFLKTFVFTLGFVLILPGIFGLNGVWLSVPLSELAAVLLSFFFMMRFRHRYICPKVLPVSQEQPPH